MKNTYLLVGSGRLAHHLRHWLGLQGTSSDLSQSAQKKAPADQKSEPKIIQWDRSQDPHLLTRLTKEATHILLAVSDDAIWPVYERYFAGHGKAVIHFSGARSFPDIIGAHPMMTFSWDLYEQNVYERISWALDKGHYLTEIFPHFPNPWFTLSAQEKPLYHALCVAGGNIPQILWSFVEAEGKKLGIARNAWELYWQQSLKNFVSNGAPAVTGPFVRGDQKTLEMNQQALGVASDELAKIYNTFKQLSQSEKFKKLAKPLEKSL